jgi:hypothetical protein
VSDQGNGGDNTVTTESSDTDESGSDIESGSDQAVAGEGLPAESGGDNFVVDSTEDVIDSGDQNVTNSVGTGDTASVATVTDNGAAVSGFGSDQAVAGEGLPAESGGDNFVVDNTEDVIDSGDQNVANSVGTGDTASVATVTDNGAAVSGFGSDQAVAGEGLPAESGGDNFVVDNTQDVIDSGDENVTDVIETGDNFVVDNVEDSIDSGQSEITNPGSPLSASDYPYLKPPYDDSVGATPGKMPTADPVTVAQAPPGWPDLPAGAADTFQGNVEPTTAVGGVTYYRSVGEGSYPGGSFWTTTPPTNMSRSDLAIKGSWNSMSGVVEFTPNPGETIPGWHGSTAPQAVTMPDGSPGYLPGRADQIWVPQNAFNNSNGTFTIRPMGGK